MKILVGSKNASKIEGVKIAFSKFFDNLEVEGVDVESEVSNQPVNAETMQGAKNRVKNLKAYAANNNLNIDYYVAVESGLIDVWGDPAIINACFMEDSNGLTSYGYSAGFPIPEGRFNDVATKGLSGVIDEVFNSAPQQGPKVLGGIHKLTNGVMGRQEFAVNSCIMALTRFLHSEWR